MVVISFVWFLCVVMLPGKTCLLVSPPNPNELVTSTGEFFTVTPQKAAHLVLN